MSLGLQHLLVFLLVAGCGAMVAWQLVKTFRSSGQFGACCSKGCSAAERPAEGRRVVFIPVESLGRKRPGHGRGSR